MKSALDGRGDKIRTCDPHVPNVVLYQTEPHLDENFSTSIITQIKSFFKYKFFDKRIILMI